MKKIVVFIIISVLLILPMGSGILAYGNSDYEISSYVVDIKIGSDNVYEVTETITADFYIPKHGIFRKIPVRYEGNHVRISNILINEQYTRSQSEGNIVLKIGDPNTTFKGSREYVIKYTFSMGKDRYQDYDLFYFNIIGDGWDTSISNIKFTLEFPEFFKKENVSFYTGEHGETDSDGVTFETMGLKIKGSKEYLPPYQGITAHVILPETAFAGEDSNNKTTAYSVGAWIICAFLIYAAWLIWNKKGRDDTLYPAVQFTPPDGMTPAEVGYVIDGIVDNKDITSLIFYWADKGYIDVSESGKNEFLFVKKSEPDTNNDYETYMFSKLFSYGAEDGWVSTNDLKQAFYEDIPIIRTQIKEKYEKNRALFTRESKVWSSVLYVSSLLPLFLMLAVIVQGIPPLELVSTAVVFGVSLLVGGAAVIQVLKKWHAFTHGGKIARIILFGMLIVILSLVFFMLAFAVEDSFSYVYHTKGFLISEGIRTALTAFALIIFSAVTIKRTKFGHEKLEYLLGLKNFIMEAEMDRIKQMIDDDPDYFYNILPYAIVLGLEKKWAGKMSDITMPPPEYFRSAAGMPLSTTFTTGSLLRCISRTGFVMSIGKSSGSGGSGGGFSGGGGGGGGGGSW